MSPAVLSSSAAYLPWYHVSRRRVLRGWVGNFAGRRQELRSCLGHVRRICATHAVAFSHPLCAVKSSSSMAFSLRCDSMSVCLFFVVVICDL